MLYFLPFLAGILIACSELSTKFVANGNHRAETKSILANVLGIVFSLLLVPFEAVQMNWSPEPLLILFLNGAVMAVGYVLYFASFKHVDLSLATILSKTSVLVFTLGGVYLFHDRLTTLNTIGAALIIVSLLVLPQYGRLKGIKLDKWMAGIMFVGTLFGTSILLDNYLSAFYSPFLYLALMFLVSSVLLVGFYAIRDRAVFQIPEKRFILAQSASTLLNVAGMALLLATYRFGGMVSLSNLIALVRLPIVVLLGLFLLKETDNKWRKLASMSLLIFGLVLLKL